MTSASEFLGGFGLKSGSDIQLSSHAFTVKRAHTEPVVVKKEKESYEYPFQLTVLPGSTSGSALSAANVQSLFSALVSSPKVVYNAYGSPYDCTISKISCKAEEKKKKAAKPKKQKTGDNDEKAPEPVEVSFIIDATGAAHRNHELPTKSQSNSAAMAVPIEIRKLYQSSGYEIRKSAFANAKCAQCHGAIEVGEYIAKNKSDEKGGWIHFSCVRKQNPLDEAGAVAAEAKKKTKGKKKDSSAMDEDKKKKRAAAPGAPPAAIKKLYTTDFDVRTSAFDSSFCAICDDQIDKGEWICKVRSNEEPGGWSHFNCLRKKETKTGDDLKDIPAEEDADAMKEFIDDEENEGGEEDEEKRMGRRRRRC